MEQTLHQSTTIDRSTTISFDKASENTKTNIKKTEELSCNQLVKNLLKTNLRLLKLNDISSVLLF